MKIQYRRVRLLVAILMVAGLLPGSVLPARAHCDSLDGPIVLEARMALETGNPTPVLKWVPAASETEVRRAFERAHELRAQGGGTRELADQWFLETLIRVHRAGEGEPYTGLKPRGSVASVLLEADAALAEGDVHSFAAAIARSVGRQIDERFERAVELRAHADESVEAGRRYVAAYVEYVHFVESLDRLLQHGEHSNTSGQARVQRH